jgi:hypothetical protein
MKESKFARITLVLFIILLSLGIGSRLFFGPSGVSAKQRVQYKVISLMGLNAVTDYEKLLNDMADKGWELDQVVYKITTRQLEWATFRKPS